MKFTVVKFSVRNDLPRCAIDCVVRNVNFIYLFFFSDRQPATTFLGSKVISARTFLSA